MVDKGQVEPSLMTRKEITFAKNDKGRDALIFPDDELVGRLRCFCRRDSNQTSPAGMLISYVKLCSLSRSVSGCRKR